MSFFTKITEFLDARSAYEKATIPTETRAALKSLCESARVGDGAPAAHKREVLTDFFLRTMRLCSRREENAYLDNRFVECSTRVLSSATAGRALEILVLVTDGAARLSEDAPMPRTMKSVPDEKRLASMILLAGTFHDAKSCARAVAEEGGNASEKAVRDTAAWGEKMRTDASLREMYVDYIV